MLGDRSGYINEHYYEYVTLKYSEIYNVTYNYISDMKLQFNKNGTVNIKQLREIINNFSKIKNLNYPEFQSKRAKEIHDEIQVILSKIKKLQCYGCKYQEKHVYQHEKINLYQKELDELNA